MKTILVPTDLSPAANNAATYATQLGKFLKATITLFNAGGIPENKGMTAILPGRHKMTRRLMEMQTRN